MSEDRIIAYCNEAFQEVACEELRARGLVPVPVAPGVIEIAEGTSFAHISRSAQIGDLMFLRQIFPVGFECSELQGQAEFEAEAAAPLRGLLAAFRGKNVSIHVRGTPGGMERTGLDLLVAYLHNTIGEEGFVVQRKDPEVVVSLLSLPGKLLLGVSDVKGTLSSWAGGEVRFRKDLEQVSRSEFKLLEALQVFAIPVPPEGRALDLGAAPGGWTRVLVEHGMRVVAVDPAPLDPRLTHVREVDYFAGTSQEFLRAQGRAASAQFDLIVNDMRMDPGETAHMMGEMADCLAPHGYALVTLKLRSLPTRQVLQEVHAARAILQEAFQITGARQLFHNRSEVTVCMKYRPIQ